jgi:hypothetical protein
MYHRSLALTMLTGAAVLGVAGLAESAALAATPMHHRYNVCGTRPVLQKQALKKTYAPDEEPTDPSIVAANSTMVKQLTKRHLYKGQAALRYLKRHRSSSRVPVLVHVVYKGRLAKVSRGEIRQQLKVINRSYPHPFAFKLRKIDYRQSAAWVEAGPQSDAEDAMKRATRRGTARTLNIWINDLKDTSDPTKTLLGHATFPWQYKSKPKLDGFVLNYKELPGVSRRGPHTQGKTAVHEIGHWMGLLHTFHDACNPPGDYVSDTPPERNASSGCPKSRNTCKAKGNDPIHNYMDYSSDPCLHQFTKGQLKRMAQAWLAFRDKH